MFDLPNAGVVQIRGADAAKVINNLCTNDIKKLAIGSCCEAFITNVRGWCVEHGFVLHLPDEILLVGQFGNPAALCAHIDRYIIREDAQVEDLSAGRCVLLLSEQEANQAVKQFGVPELQPAQGKLSAAEIAHTGVLAFSVRLLAANDVMWIFSAPHRTAIVDSLTAAGIASGTADDFERLRIAGFWPRSGREILEKSLPQELDRDPQAVSFTKGCYLGQETIARLDAIGQLQKKLCLVRIDSSEAIEQGTPLLRGEQTVGQISSSATILAADHQLALAYLRRGNFDPGVQLTCGGVPAAVLLPCDN